MKTEHTLRLAHDAYDPGREINAGDASDEEGDIRLVQACSREREKIAVKLGVSLRTEGNSRCGDEDGIATTCAAIGVAHQSAHDLGVIPRGSDGAGVREHQPTYPET
jgi:hypothetical protein